MSISGNHCCNVAHKHRIILARMGGGGGGGGGGAFTSYGKDP